MFPEQPYLSQCPSCSAQIDVSALEPFAKINCPECKQSVRVRRKFDHFLIIKQIGEGGMSRVFEAEDETLGRRVALKILNRTYSRDAARMAQFQQEALTTARVTHPNVIKLYSVGYDQGHFFIAMELVNGGSLEGRIKRDGQVPEKDALRIGRQVAEGLRAAFRMGLLHRDVKPANILFTEDGTAKVVDFGLALFTNLKDETGEIWATPYYVAPEKVIDNEEDFRSDLFSLGATLYHALTGRPPHKASSNSIHELRMIKCRRVSLEETGMPFAPRTEHVVDRLVAFKPEDRPESYDAAVDELRLAEGLTGRAVMSRMSMRRKVAITAVAATVLAYSIGWLMTLVATTKPVAQYGSSTTLNNSSLLGGTTTVSSGQVNLSELFLGARKTLIEGKVKQAEHQFEDLINAVTGPQTPARQQTVNWARFNAAICAVMGEQPGRVRKMLAEIGKEPNGEDASATAFFVKVSKLMGDNLGLGKSPDELGYNDANEEAMGYLIHGLAQWHFGDPLQGARNLLKFLDSRQVELRLEWMDQYRGLIAGYAEDLRRVTLLMAKPDAKLPLVQAEALLAETTQVKNILKTQGRVRGLLDQRIEKLSRSIREQKLVSERADMKKQMDFRNHELNQLADLTESLSNLVRGYDFSPAINILNGMQFKSPEVQASVDSKLYLYTGARDFMSQLFGDLASRGWTGRLMRQGAAPLDGRVTKATLRDITVTLSNGELTIQMDQIAPDMLVDMAQFFAGQVSDSTDWYRRQELIAIFARVEGQQAIANTVAGQLMEENRPFRARWLKILQSGT